MTTPLDVSTLPFDYNGVRVDRNPDMWKAYQEAVRLCATMRETLKESDGSTANADTVCDALIRRVLQYGPGKDVAS